MKAPITYVPHFVAYPESDVFFDKMWAHLPWENREGAPRRECWFNAYGQAYTYGSGDHARTYEAHAFGESPVTSAIWSIMHSINGQFGTDFDCCFVNGYAHGRQHLGWHADDSPEMDLDHPIAIVSLGTERDIWFRPKPPKIDVAGQDFIRSIPVTADENKVPLGNGSLCLMHAGMQRDWQHRIPKSADVDCGPRLSLTFRRLVR